MLSSRGAKIYGGWTGRRYLTEGVMAFRNKIYFIILGIVAQLLFFGDARADELRPSASEQELVMAAAHDNLTLGSSQPWRVEGREGWGRLAAYGYDDRTTERPAA